MAIRRVRKKMTGGTAGPSGQAVPARKKKKLPNATGGRKK